jgi:hypothetical protein
MVYEGVRDRIDIPFEDLGEQEVKNIDRPVRVWRWAADAGLAPSISAKTDEPLSLPDKPSIAVLPFTNMSGDAEQEYFSDGIAKPQCRNTGVTCRSRERRRKPENPRTVRSAGGAKPPRARGAPTWFSVR